MVLMCKLSSRNTITPNQSVDYGPSIIFAKLIHANEHFLDSNLASVFFKKFKKECFLVNNEIIILVVSSFVVPNPTCSTSSDICEVTQEDMNKMFSRKHNSFGDHCKRLWRTKSKSFCQEVYLYVKI